MSISPLLRLAAAVSASVILAGCGVADNSDDTTAASGLEFAPPAEPVTTEHLHEALFGGTANSGSLIADITDYLPVQLRQWGPNGRAVPYLPISVPGQPAAAADTKSLTVRAEVTSTAQGTAYRQEADPAAGYLETEPTDWSDPEAVWRTVVLTLDVTSWLGATPPERPVTVEVREVAADEAISVGDAIWALYQYPQDEHWSISGAWAVAEDGKIDYGDDTRLAGRIQTAAQLERFAAGPGEIVVLDLDSRPGDIRVLERRERSPR